MVAGISQTIMLLLRLLVNFKTFRHCNVEFTLVTLIVDAFMLWINSRMLIVTIWCSQWSQAYCRPSWSCWDSWRILRLSVIAMWNLQFNSRMLIVSIWYSQCLHDYLTSGCLLSHTCLYFHSELALNTFIHKSRVVCLKLFFERRLLKISIVTLATVFILHELN